MKRLRVLRYRVVGGFRLAKPTVVASVYGGYILRFPGSKIVFHEPTFDEALAHVRRWYEINSHPAAGA